MSNEKQTQDNSVQENNTTGSVGDGEGRLNQAGAGLPDTPPKKKFSAGMKIAIALIAVLAVGVAGFASSKIYQAVKKANMDPTEYYQYVMKQGREKSLKNVTGYYNVSQKALSGDQANRELDMTLKVSDTAKSMMSLSGLDFTGLQDLGIHLVYGTKGDNMLAGLDLKANGEQFLSGKVAVDLKAQKAYIQLPELSSSYLDFSKSLSELPNGADSAMFSFGKQAESLPSGKELEEWLVRYSDILINSASDVEKKKEDVVEVEDISEKATAYVYSMKNEKITDALQQFAKELQKDKVVKKILDAADKQKSAEFTEALKQLQVNLAAELSKEKIGEAKVGVETGINGSDRVVSQKVTVESEGKEQISFYIAYPKDGDKFGEEIIVQFQGKELFKVSGSGTDKSGVINGEFKVGMDSSLLEGSNLVNTDELLIIKLKDYDYSGMARGKIKGTLTLSTSAVAALANCSVVIDQEGSAESMKQTVKVMMGKDTLVTIDMTSKGNATLPDAVPGDQDKVYNADSASDMVLYESELDVVGVLKKLQDKTGIDFSSLFDLATLGDEGFTDPGDIMDGEETGFVAGPLW